MKRTFFAGPQAALNDSPTVLTGPSGLKYSVRVLDELDDHVLSLYRRAVSARDRGFPTLAAHHLADIDALLDRRSFMVMCDPTSED